MWELDHKEGWALRNWCFQTVVLDKTLGNSLESRKKTLGNSILKEIDPEYSVEGLMLKLKVQYFGHLLRRADSLENTLMLRKTKGRGWPKMTWLDDIIDSMDMSLSKRWEMVKEKEGLACCSPWGRKELDMTGRLNNNTFSAVKNPHVGLPWWPSKDSALLMPSRAFGAPRNRGLFVSR